MKRLLARLRAWWARETSYKGYQETGKTYWKMSGNRIIPDFRPRCQATHPDQGPCELPDAHAGKHGWALPKVSEDT